MYDRERELSELDKVLGQSRIESRMTVVMGRRRIGKTELIRRCGDIHEYQSYIENGALGQLARVIERDYDTFAGHALERYFERKLRESGKHTRIGQYWDRKGENELDLIAVNDIDNTVELYEVKKNRDKFEKKAFENKVKYFKQNCEQIKKMRITTGDLSIEDM